MKTVFLGAVLQALFRASAGMVAFSAWLDRVPKPRFSGVRSADIPAVFHPYRIRGNAVPLT